MYQTGKRFRGSGVDNWARKHLHWGHFCPTRRDLSQFNIDASSNSGVVVVRGAETNKLSSRWQQTWRSAGKQSYNNICLRITSLQFEACEGVGVGFTVFAKKI
jgi:hypothetical protein